MMICIPASDEELFSWIDANEGGYVINSDRAKSVHELPMLHRAVCGHINDRSWSGYTNANFKLCSAIRQELEMWIEQQDDRELKLCKNCKP
jgi:hypothetical protein